MSVDWPRYELGAGEVEQILDLAGRVADDPGEPEFYDRRHDLREQLPAGLRGIVVALRDQRLRVLGLAAVFVIVIQFVLGGKSYYPGGIYTFCFAAGSQLLGDSHYIDRARQLAHTALDYFTPEGLLFGEGHPLKLVSAKGWHSYVHYQQVCALC